VSDRARKSNAAMIIGHGHNAPRIFGGRIPAVARFVGPKERIRFLVDECPPAARGYAKKERVCFCWLNLFFSVFLSVWRFDMIVAALEISQSVVIMARDRLPHSATMHMYPFPHATSSESVWCYMYYSTCGVAVKGRAAIQLNASGLDGLDRGFLFLPLIWTSSAG